MTIHSIEDALAVNPWVSKVLYQDEFTALCVPSSAPEHAPPSGENIPPAYLFYVRHDGVVRVCHVATQRGQEMMLWEEAKDLNSARSALKHFPI